MARERKRECVGLGTSPALSFSSTLPFLIGWEEEPRCPQANRNLSLLTRFAAGKQDSHDATYGCVCNGGTSGYEIPAGGSWTVTLKSAKTSSVLGGQTGWHRKLPLPVAEQSCGSSNPFPGSDPVQTWTSSPPRLSLCRTRPLERVSSPPPKKYFQLQLRRQSKGSLLQSCENHGQVNRDIRCQPSPPCRHKSSAGQYPRRSLSDD